MTADSPKEVSSGNEIQTSPGLRLKLQREQQALTRRHVAEKLKLLPQQIEHLEADEYHRFNGDIFCRAHLRSYANLLNLDPNEILALYQDLAGETSRRSVQAPSRQEEATRNLRNTGSQMQVQRPGRGHSLRYWGVATAASLAIILWISQPESVQTPLPLSDVVDPNDQSTLEVLDADNLLSTRVPATAELAEDFSEADREAVVLDLPAGEPLVRPQTDGDPALALADPDQLKFSFSADCWVEVSDGNGVTIFAALKRAQESLTLQGKGPFKVLLGYAHGVSLNYNGEPIEINVNNRNNSARLVVGNLPVR